MDLEIHFLVADQVNNNIAILKVLETIREKDPPRPSARLSSSTNEAITGISGQRRIDSKKLKIILRGELDWIAMKTLEKDRTRRYETASALTDDVSRFLQGEPVKACPPSVSYRLRKKNFKAQVADPGSRSHGFVTDPGNDSIRAV